MIIISKNSRTKENMKAAPHKTSIPEDMILLSLYFRIAGFCLSGERSAGSFACDAPFDSFFFIEHGEKANCKR
jgi:hypothetical protein